MLCALSSIYVITYPRCLKSCKRRHTQFDNLFFVKFNLLGITIAHEETSFGRLAEKLCLTIRCLFTIEYRRSLPDFYDLKQFHESAK